MKGEHIRGLETRANWLAWCEVEGKRIWADIGHEAHKAGEISDPHEYLQSLAAYRKCLQIGDSYYMNREFCDLADHARRSVPDDLAFDSSWMLSDHGWMWLDTPFEVPIPREFANKFPQHAETDGKPSKPTPPAATIHAIGWMKIGDGAYHFFTYQALAEWDLRRGFGCWTHMTLRDGEQVLPRIHTFEGSMATAGRNGGTYIDSRLTDEMHEIRWMYAAFHLMAQRLTHRSQERTAKHIVRIGQQNKRPVPPFFTVISLRRLEEHREAHGKRDVRWQWQWHVRGHWRLQPYKDGTKRQIFIEAYIKGPAGKPLKLEGHKLFVAAR